MTILSLIITHLLACQKAQTSEATKPSTAIIIDLANHYPTNEKVKHDIITLGVRATGFQLSKQHPNAEEYIELIQNAFIDKTPLRIEFNRNTLVIQHINTPTDAVTERWENTTGYMYDSIHTED